MLGDWALKASCCACCTASAALMVKFPKFIVYILRPSGQFYAIFVILHASKHSPPGFSGNYGTKKVTNQPKWQMERSYTVKISCMV
jgi:hypothetical protein